MRLLIKVLQASKLMPDAIMHEEVLRIPEQYDPLWYRVPVYPHKRQQMRESFSGLMVPANSPGLPALEKLIDFRFATMEVEKFVKVSRTHEDLALAPHISQIIAEPSEGFLQRYTDIMGLIGIPRMAHRIWLDLVGFNLPRWAMEFIHVLQHLNHQFRRLRCSHADFAKLKSSLRPISQRALVYALAQLNLLEQLTFGEQFPVILTVVEALLLVQKFEKHEDSLLPLIVRELTGGAILSTYLVMNNFAMRIPTFGAVCSDAEHRLWLKFESAILFTLNSDAVFLDACIGLQENFTQIADQYFQETVSREQFLDA
jgi:hypothetical protein